MNSNKSDRSIISLLILFNILQISLLLTGIFLGNFSIIASVVNMLTGLSVIVYWLIKQFRIVRHYFETREVLVLVFELIIVVFAVFHLLTTNGYPWLIIMQGIIFCVHLVVSVFMLVFMLTFKMRKLF